jgi:hypothetical protein
MSKSYSIPVSNGIFAHCQKIGAAIWVFLWMIDHTTKEATGTDGDLEGLVFGGLPVRASVIAKDLEIATRTIHEHIERLCQHGYLLRIAIGDGLPSGYSVRKSKKWRRNQIALATVEGATNFAEIREPSQDSANLLRGFTVDPRGNPPDPREFPLPIRKTVQDNTEQTTKDEFASGGKIGKAKKSTIEISSEDVERVYQAYPLKKAPGAARTAISKAFDRLTQRGEADPASFLIDRIAEMKAARARDAAKGNFVPAYKYPATWFNEECYDEEDLQPVKNFLLPNGVLGTEAELQATGWQVMRGVA